MDLLEIARKLTADLDANRPEQVTPDVTALCIAEEAGELIGAYRRYSGRARRAGSLDEVRLEMADVLINLGLLALELEINLDAAVEDKLRIIYSRGWGGNHDSR